MPDGYFIIGSREQLLYAKGDLIGASDLGIVAATRDLAALVQARLQLDAALIWVIYLETYGGKITAAARQYTGSLGVGQRLFDVCSFGPERLDMADIARATWRESGGQNYLDETALKAVAEQTGLALTARLSVEPLPTEIPKTLAWLEAALPETRAALDDGAGKQPEGVVVRTPDRSVIAKIRFADYRRHLKKPK